MATINLGAIKFNWKGAYNSGNSYAVDDVVSSGGNSYVCIQAHSNQAVGNATAYWNIMSSAGTNGTNGTDVGTTITTQGDLLYRDGSGLQRLGAGTAGQVLQTGGSGANPSWGTVSSDYVKLATVTANGSSSGVSIDGYFTSDYDYYELVGYNIISTSNANLRGRVNVGGSSQSGSNYDHATIVPYRNSSNGNAHDNFGGWKDQDFRICYNSVGTSLTNPGFLNMQIFNPLSTASVKAINYQMRAADGSSQEVGTTFGGARYDATSAISGLTLFPNNGNISGTFKLYGVK